MTPFNLQSHLDLLYTRFPQAEKRPVIGLTSNFAAPEATLGEAYYNQVVAAGGTPVIIPPLADKDVIINTLEQLDGLILTGGADFNPLWAGEQPQPGLHRINAQRDLPELLITQLAYDRNIPILGICRGIQALAMTLGGTIVQDIESRTVKHTQDADRNLPTHTVATVEHSIIRRIYGETVYVNSFHHQAVGKAGPRFRVTATAPDGTIEAIESTEHRPVIGVQWHPECLEEDGLKIFQWLTDQARNFHAAKQLHNRLLTLDTHVDTPMFFHQGIHFDQRDKRIKVDLQKMTEGRQDAVIMAAYLPQPKMGEQFSQKVAYPVNGNDNANNPSSLTPHPSSKISPFSYANLIFDQIEQIVKQNSRYLSIARTPADLYEDKRKGRRSIMLAIENGLALEHDLANLRHFAQRGIVYMTLCHNGDNDICDSARGCNTHQGVTQFGEKVIAEMNRLGIMVDLSHAAEKSFYDAIDISATPIVCSHSNCRALCDHPRNLTDDQLRALARQGGVAQITLYPGFLSKSGEASVIDAVAHLEHAISVMGIDHVGIGSDFDGDGGVTGFNHSGEAINFTLHLLRRKYSERDIQKIWGGNWLRVMSNVQKKNL